MNRVHSLFAPQVLPEVDFNDFTRAVNMLQQRSGIVIGSHKRDMAERALALRAKALELATVNAYLQHLTQNPADAEWQEFINSFTINHTAFFREEHHFDVLARFVKTRQKPLSFWSASCSTGEEPYSIAIQLCETLGALGTNVSILATDIDSNAIEVAKAGMYTLDRVKNMPEAILKKYFQRGTGARAGMARVKSNIRDMVQYEVLNLLDTSWPFRKEFDVIFCRNTLIYFDKSTQTQILERFARVLKPGGLLFAGHSENLTYLTEAFNLLGQTVYEVSPK